MIQILRSAAVLCAIALVAGAGLSGCSNDDGSTPAPGGPTGPFTGTYVDSGGNGGVLSFTIEAAAGVSPVTTLLAPGDVAGTVQVAGGGAFDLSGTYSASSGLDLADAGSNFRFQGALQSDGHFEGTCCFAPGGPVAWATHPGDATSVHVLCGSYSRCTDPGCSVPVYLYPLTLVVAGTSASVATIELSLGQPIAVPATVTSGGGQSVLDFVFGQIQATGDLTGDYSSSSGTWVDTGGLDTGIWSATAAQCVTGR